MNLQNASDSDSQSEDIESDEEKELFLKVNIRGKAYVYKGPKDQQVKDLFDILESKKKKSSKYRFINFVRNMVEKLEQFFEKKCRFKRNYQYLQFDFIITFYDFMLSLIFLAMYGLFLVRWIPLFQEAKVTTSQVLSFMTNNIAVYGGIFTIYGMIIIHQGSRILNMILFISLFVTQIVIFYFIARAGLFENKDGQTQFETIFIFSMPVFLFLHWFIVGQVFRFVKNQFGEFKSCICGSIYCFAVPFYLFTNVATYIFVTDENNAYSIVNTIVTILAIPVSIMFLVSWSILHYKMFALPLNSIQKAIIGIKQDLMEKFKKSEDIDENEGKCKRFIKLNIGNITSIIMGSVYLISEYYLIISFVSQIANENIEPETTVVLVFEIIAIPVYVILGIHIGASSRRQADNFLFIPLFLIALPLLFLYPLSRYLLTVETTKIIAEIVLFGPPCTSLIWLILSILGIKRRVPFLFCSTYVCLFFALPLGLLYPLSQLSSIDQSNKDIINSFFGILLGVGVSLILIYILYRLIRAAYLQYKHHKEDQNNHKKKKHDKAFFIDVKKLVHWNFQNYGFMANASGFIIGYGLLVWLIYNYPSDISQDEHGYVLGMLVTLPVMFILLNYALRSRSLQLKGEDDEDEDDDNDFNLAMDQDFEDMEQGELENRRKMQKIQKFASYVGIILPVVICLPLAIIVGVQYLRTMFLVIMVGIPLSFLCYRLFTYIKNANQEYQNLLTPCMVSICWSIFLIPFGILLPVYSSLVKNNTESYGSFMRKLVGATVIFFMIGITAITMFVHIYFNKIEEERKKKFVIDKLLELLAESSYRSDNLTLSRLYQKFNSTTQTKLKKRLENKEPVTRIIDPKKGSEFEYRLITDKLFQKLQNSKNNKKTKKAKKKGWMSLCIDIFCCRIGQGEDSDDDDDDDDPKNDKDIAKELLKGEGMDQFFPQEFKQKMLSAQDQQQLAITHQLELNENNLMFEKFAQNETYGTKPREEINSSKTEMLRGMSSDDPNNLAQQEFKYTSYGIELQDHEKARIEFMHDIWQEFMNTDDYFPPSIIYNDWLELMRISNIWDPTGPETSYLDQQTVVRIYDQNAQVPWKSGLLVLDLKQFSVCIKNLAREIYPDEADINKSLKSVIIEVFYVNLLHNLKNFAINYRANTRQKIRRTYEQQQALENSPFNIQPDENVNEDERIRRIDLMAEPDIPPKTQDDLKEQDQQQQNIIISEFGREIVVKPKKEKKKKPCHIRCLYGFCRCMRKVFCVYPLECFAWATGKVEEKLQKLFGQKKQKRYFNQLKGEKRKAISWERLIDLLINQIEEAQDEYDEIIKAKKGLTYQIKQWDFGNLMAFFSKISDLYSIFLIAFSNNVTWIPGLNPTTEEDTAKYAVTDGSFINSFFAIYLASIGMALLYSYLTKIAYPYMKNEKLGQDKDGNKAGFPHPQFFLTKSLQVLGGTGFMIIMRTLLDSFICVWQGDGPWYLYRDSNVQCLSNQHMLMMLGSIVGLACYYPISTYMFPTFQFQDKGLELKYDPVFVVGYIQAKLLILGVTSFFKSFGQDQHPEISRYFQLGTASMCMFLVTALNIKIRPCLINWVNLVETCMYLQTAIINGGGLIISYTGQPILGPVLVFPTMFVVFAGTFIIYRKYYRTDSKKKLNQVNANLPQFAVTKKIQIMDDSESGSNFNATQTSQQRRQQFNLNS